MREEAGVEIGASGGSQRRGPAAALLTGAGIGVLGGMIGLGGAEFRLPILISVFGFVALQAVIMNKAMSLVVVMVALPARLLAVPPGDIAEHGLIIVNLLAGSLAGAWLGAIWATRLRSVTLHRVLAALLVVMAVGITASHSRPPESLSAGAGPLLDGANLVVAGVAAGVVIGVVAALMGVAGGELLIPTIVLLWGVGIKTAGSLSLLVSLPTMLVAFARYSRDGSFAVLSVNRAFLLWMAAGSVAGTVVGGVLLRKVSADLLVPVLALLLLVSAVKVWRHH